jgi:oxygen-independent coproporphyrinogen-3 oxidase
MNPLGIYVHIPFCRRKCSYCDFNAYSGLGELVDSYVVAVCKEIANSVDFGKHVSTIFFGGGTPTFLTGSQISHILGVIRENFEVDTQAEISSEANPTNSDASKFKQMKSAGFNRISIGVQSFDNSILKLIDREHSGTEAENAVHAARRAGFANVSIDLMFGLPTQSLEEWEGTLDRAIELKTQHLSTYALTIEPGTRFERLHKGGKLRLPDDETELAMYERSIEKLQSAGFEHYEVSNFARPNHRSKHNMIYWRNEEYLGFGSGAVSYRHGVRWTNERHPQKYISCLELNAPIVADSEELDLAGRISETLIQGLRLREGVSLSCIASRFNTDLRSLFRDPLAKLQGNRLVELNGDSLRLSHRGLLMANDVFVELLP